MDAGIAGGGGEGTHRFEACAGQIAQAVFPVPVFSCLLCPSALKILLS